MNAHHPERMAELFAPDFRSEQPAHPILTSRVASELRMQADEADLPDCPRDAAVERSASSSPMPVAFTFFAICTRSSRIGIISWRL
jgi:hypothetical protein